MRFRTLGIRHQAGFVSSDIKMGDIMNAVIASYVKDHDLVVCLALFHIRFCLPFLMFQFFAFIAADLLSWLISGSNVLRHRGS